MFAGVMTLMTRAMRVDARLLRTHILRLLLVLFVYLMLILLRSSPIGLGAPGLQYFLMTTYLNLIFITLGGMSLFPTVITEEKEEMTLGLLKMAGINSISILLGKMMPRLLTAILLLSGQLPFNVLAITLGGVTWDQVIAAYSGLLAHLVLLANIGLFFSVISPTSNSAATRTVILVLTFMLLPWWILAMLNQAIASGEILPGSILVDHVVPVLRWLTEASAISRISGIMVTGFAASALSLQVISNLAAGAVFFLLAWVAFPIVNREEATASPDRSSLLKRMMTKRFFGSNAGRAWTPALIWKDFHFIVGGTSMIVVKFVGYGLLIGIPSFAGYYFQPQYFKWRDVGDGAMVTMLIAFCVEGGLIAARVFREEIKWQTFSSVALLPLPLAMIAYTKVFGCLISLVPAITYFAVGVFISPENFFDTFVDLIQEPGGWFSVVLYLVFIHLTTLLSLFVKWGAMVLSFMITYVGTWFLLVFVSLLSRGGVDDGIFVVFAFMGLMLSVFLQIAIGLRLRQVVAS